MLLGSICPEVSVGTVMFLVPNWIFIFSFSFFFFKQLSAFPQQEKKTRHVKVLVFYSCMPSRRDLVPLK
jgi:hypothetical protein